MWVSTWEIGSRVRMTKWCHFVHCVIRLYRKFVSQADVSVVYRWGRSEPKTEAGVLKRTALKTWLVSDTSRARIQYHSVHFLNQVMWPVYVGVLGGMCMHKHKGTDLSWLRKVTLDKSWNLCEACEQEKETESENEDGRDASAIWICLKCGHRVSDTHTGSSIGMAPYCISSSLHRELEPLFYTLCSKEYYAVALITVYTLCSALICWKRNLRWGRRFQNGSLLHL